MTEPSLELLCEGLREHTAGLARMTDGAAPERHVPTCPEWCLRDLVAHVGNGHRWAATLVAERSADLLPMVPEKAPDDPAQWPGWLRDGAERLLDAVDTVGPDTTVWTFLGPRPARFWVRRMLYDTAVHHADAAISVDRLDGYALASDLAADAIDEAMDMLSGPRAATLNPSLAKLRGDGERIALRPSEPHVTGWLITRRPDGVACQRTADADADVTLRGSVTDLLLVLSRRVPPEEPHVAVSGDRPLLDHWLSLTAFG
ncbi:maleylpyruvate isomerase family mycothiol-dependent enzyme [Actinomadura miaoliensis]|uniref:Maleylpyruvate isomerase family mycothiol-dependent enzyme n=1 Tax=Actinomadura miaoliensis TaxID=430685 RepID=A0ABP7WNP2_9ACTN